MKIKIENVDVNVKTDENYKTDIEISNEEGHIKNDCCIDLKFVDDRKEDVFIGFSLMQAELLRDSLTLLLKKAKMQSELDEMM